MRNPYIYATEQKNGKASFTKLEDMTINGQSLGNVINELQATNRALITQLDSAAKEIARLRYLEEVKFSSIVFDEAGFITQVNPIDHIMETQQMPADIAEGWYRLEDGNLVLDVQMKSAKTGQ